MKNRIAYNPNMILPAGTQVVTRVAVRVVAGDASGISHDESSPRGRRGEQSPLQGDKASSQAIRHPAGSVGVITRSPVDHTHTYRVRFADGSEASLRRAQFAVLKHEQRDRIWSPQNVLDEFELMQSVIYRCVVGSRAYGLDVDESDTDRRGIYLPPAEMHWSLGGVPQQLESDETQECYWELQKFLTLALKANPNVLECLYSPLVEHATPIARRLLEMREAFLSKLVYQTYNGYVLSQFKKITARVQSDRDIKWKHAMHLIRLLLSGIVALREGYVPVAVEKHRDRLLAIRHGEMPWPQVDAWRLELHRQFEAAYAETKLPDRPDFARVNTLLIWARSRSIRGFTKRTGMPLLSGEGSRHAPAFVIMRVNRWPLEESEPRLQSECWSGFANGLTPVRVVWCSERAKEEVRRLNRLNGGKGVRYFWQYTRVECGADVHQSSRSAEGRVSMTEAPHTEAGEGLTTLFRPVGQAEWDKIVASGRCRFPPRLPFQPIFYPVLVEEYAARIARDWNTTDSASGFVGYVTRFRVRSEFLSRYDVHCAGDRACLEYWIPAEDIEAFNDNIVGEIEVIHEFRGKQ